MIWLVPVIFMSLLPECYYEKILAYNTHTNIFLVNVYIQNTEIIKSIDKFF
jgi:hypothetical protein